MSFPTRLISLNLNGHCLFCLGSVKFKDFESERLQRLLVLDRRRDGGGIQEFFWSLLVGLGGTSRLLGRLKGDNETAYQDGIITEISGSGGGDSEEGVIPSSFESEAKIEAGQEEGQVCQWSFCVECGATVGKVEKLYQELEKVQMLLIDRISDIQEVVKKCRKGAHRKMTRFGGRGSRQEHFDRLVEFQEEVICKNKQSRRIPLVLLEKWNGHPVPFPSGTTTLNVESGQSEGGEEAVVKKEIDGFYGSKGNALDVNLDRDVLESTLADDIHFKKASNYDSDWSPASPSLGQSSGDEEVLIDHPKRKRGRPPRVCLENEDWTPHKKRSVGRPRKHPKKENESVSSKSSPKEEVSEQETNPQQKRKGGPGRPGPNKQKLLKSQILSIRRTVPPPPAPDVRKKRHHFIYNCDLCDKVYFKRTCFIKHKRAHEKLKLIVNNEMEPKTKQCPVCHESIKETDYFEHVFSHEGYGDSKDDKPFACSQKDCVRKFIHEENLKIHEQVDHDELNSPCVVLVKRCDICYICFDSSNELLEHFQRAHKRHLKSLIYCPVCAHTFTSTDNLVIHMRSHIAPKQQICFLCKRNFGGRHDCLQHLLGEHKIPISGECSTCQQRFEDMYDLKVHQRDVHKKKESFICSFCGKESVFLSAFMQHASSHKWMEIRGHQCPDCKEYFTNEDKLYCHRVKHHGAPKLECEYCRKEFMLPHSLKIHLREHRKEGFRCDICDKYFGIKQRYEDHMTRRHSEERPFTCERCGVSCKTKYTLNRHIKTHEKRYKCKVCGRRFSHGFYLKKHMGMHTGVTYVCEFCGYKFHSNKSCQAHRKKYHTGPNPLPLYKPQKRRRAIETWKDDDGNVIKSKLAEKDATEMSTPQQSSSNSYNATLTSGDQMTVEGFINEKLKSEVESEPLLHL